jgi:hypothetical protein
VQKVKTLMAEIEFICAISKGKFTYIFGTDAPTALDAYIVVFMMRIGDVDRVELIPREWGIGWIS